MCSIEDWDRHIAVNLWGVIYGIRTFVPQMLQQNSECCVVNVASLSGLIVAGTQAAAYKVSKFGVVALSETLYRSLAKQGSKVRVALVCPGGVRTGIMESTVNTWLQSSGRTLEDLCPEERDAVNSFQERVEAGMPPREVADKVFDAIKEGRFYVLTHPESKERIRMRMEDILLERNPTDPAPSVREIKPR